MRQSEKLANKGVDDRFENVFGNFRAVMIATCLAENCLHLGVEMSDIERMPKRESAALESKNNFFF